MFLRPSTETSHSCQLLSWLPPAVRKMFDLLLCSSLVVFVVFFVVGYILLSGQIYGNLRRVCCDFDVKFIVIWGNVSRRAKDSPSFSRSKSLNSSVDLCQLHQLLVHLLFVCHTATVCLVCGQSLTRHEQSVHWSHTAQSHLARWPPLQNFRELGGHLIGYKWEQCQVFDWSRQRLPIFQCQTHGSNRRLDESWERQWIHYHLAHHCWIATWVNESCCSVPWYNTFRWWRALTLVSNRARRCCFVGPTLFSPLHFLFPTKEKRKHKRTRENETRQEFEKVFANIFTQTEYVTDWLITMADQKSSSFLCTSHLTQQFIFLHVFLSFHMPDWFVEQMNPNTMWSSSIHDHWSPFLFPCPFCRKNRKIITKRTTRTNDLNLILFDRTMPTHAYSDVP